MKVIELVETIVSSDVASSASEDEQIEYVKEFGARIRFIDGPTEAVQLAACKSDGNAIRYIKHPSEIVQIAAVTNKSFAIQHIKNPSPKVQKLACASDPLIARYIRSPIPELIKLLLTNEIYISLPNTYNVKVRKLFKDNTLLMKKWLRYGETMRKD